MIAYMLCSSLSCCCCFLLSSCFVLFLFYAEIQYALSEEAQEARNKDYKKYRLHHARKCDRVSTNVDVMNHLLASSDPYINKLRSKPKKKYLEMHEDVKNLLCD